MSQLELELYPPNKDYIDVVIREDPYVKILGPVEWSTKWDSLVAVAQVEGSICIVSLTERGEHAIPPSFSVRHGIPNTGLA